MVSEEVFIQASTKVSEINNQQPIHSPIVFLATWLVQARNICYQMAHITHNNLTKPSQYCMCIGMCGKNGTNTSSRVERVTTSIMMIQQKIQSKAILWQKTLQKP
jgi:hypothetical protein